MPGATAEDRPMRNPVAVTLSQIRAALGDGRVLIEYFLVHDQVLGVVLSSQRLDVVPLAPLSRIRHRVRMLQFQLSKFRLDQSYTARAEKALAAATERHLRGLYEDVVAPLRSLLSGPHLVLVPHGLLHHVPLHALHDGSSYMIDSFTVSYAPSASLFALSQARTTIGRGRSLVFGIHDSNAPWILSEAHEVASVVSEPDLRLGADANQQVLKECGPHSRFIHIATHGFFRQDNPMFSAVHLGDGYLSLYDLYNLRLPVELLTLSGCATGLSVVAEGDEIMGLARGLLYAGAQSLLLTLWDVHDRSTAEFMRSFYAHMRDERTSKARALQVAMLELREKRPHPYYWAPFTLVGKTT
jgi:CHAT domain-containing protein